MFTNHLGHELTQVLDPDKEILRQWKGLHSRSLGPIDRQQVANLLDSENRELALKFRGKDAATIINVIDKLLKDDQLPPETKTRAFKLMRRLAGASRQVPKSYLVGRFTWCRVENTIIGNGGFADVRKGRLGGKDVAVKILRIWLEDEVEGRVDSIHETFCKECVVWMNMSHPNIHRLIAVKIKPNAREFSMISEMMKNGNIVIYTNKHKANRIRLLWHVASGLEYLHKCGVIHGDLKGFNILINDQKPPQACIADFGLSNIAPSMSFCSGRADSAGTFGYMAPELFAEGAQPSKEADMYAFGMLVYEVITGTRPFADHRLAELPVLTLRGSRPPTPEDPVAAGFFQGTWEFAERCWDKNPGQRPVARQAVEHLERAAKSSTVVDPGPTVSVFESANPMVGKSSGNFSRLFAPPSSNTGMFRQTSYATRVLVGNRAVPVPTFQAEWEPNGLRRMFHHLISPRSAPSLEPSPQGSK